MSPVLPEHRAENIPARVALALIRTGTVTMSKETLAARQEGLPALQASLLIRIYSSARDQCTVGALAESLGLTPPTISDSLKALVRKGLVDRRRSAKDGRVVFFNTTHRGRDVARRLGQWSRPVEQSVAEMSRVRRTFEPRPQVHELYDALYRRVYRQMYRRLRPLYAEIRDITGYPPK